MSTESVTRSSLFVAASMLVVAAGVWWIWRAGSDEPPQAVTTSIEVQTAALNDPAWRGLSDLVREPTSAKWYAVPERQRSLLQLTQNPLQIAAIVPISGVPDDLDLESLDFVDPTTLLLGTESHEPDRASDALFVLRLTGSAGQEKAKVERRIDLPYALWQIKANENHGMEGLCVLPGGKTVLVGTELAVPQAGQRLAPLGRLDLQSGTWRGHWLRLTSADGKISALACRSAATGTRLWAIERHYGTSRILTVDLPADPTSLESMAILQPTVWLDLAPNLSYLPNWEGLVPLSDNNVVLLSDNASGDVVRGPSYWLALTRK
jgi:hypothetical protein